MTTLAPPLPIDFASGDGRCVGELWLPAGANETTAVPVVLLAHGLGGTRAMGLAAYAEQFAAAGVAAVTFDYRSWGDSPGEPRDVLSIGRQREDWRAAVAFARATARFDSSRIAIWGSSFGGGHVLATAAADPQLAAVVSQCPFTDGPSSALRVDPRSTLRLTALAAADVGASVLRRGPVRVAVAGKAGQAALMTAPDALPGYQRLLSDAGLAAPALVPARIGLAIPLSRPGTVMRKIKVPTLICICEGDSVAPDGPTRRYVRKADNPLIEARDYPFGHFDIYHGAGFEQVAADQTAFLTQHLLGKSAS